MDAMHTIEEEADRLLAEAESAPLPRLLETACALGREGHGNVISYSRKVFIPLTRLCRDVCGYCTFAVGPRQAGAAYLSPDAVLAIARAGREAGCREALFTLGDKPELRYQAARSALRRLGHASTVEYLVAMCELVVRETGLLPHVNAGIATEAEIAALRRVSVSQGIMLENASPRLGEPGGPHFGSPDKDPAVRIAMIEAAGRQHVPFTSGILIGIGETRRERILSLLVLRDLHARYGHLQEIIIQNFRAKSGTRAARAGPGDEHPGAAEPELRGVPAAGKRRHQRLGRDLSGHRRSRQSRGTVAETRGAGAGDRRSRIYAGAAARHLPELRMRAGTLARSLVGIAGARRNRCRGIRARGRLGAGRGHSAAALHLSPTERGRPRSGRVRGSRSF